MKKVRIQMKKKKSCLPKKLPIEKKSIFSKYVTEYIFTNPINISIPSGNFGNAYSAWFGRRNGLPINEIFCASNLNDVLTRFISSGTLEPKDTMPTVAPSMDIQIPSSLERLIYDLVGDTSSFYDLSLIHI